MLEGMPNQEQIVTPEVVIEALDAKGVEDPEAQALLQKYAGQCEKEADSKAAEDPSYSNKANLECALALASLYAQTKNYQAQALEALLEVYAAALENQNTADIVVRVQKVIESLNLPADHTPTEEEK